MKALQKSLLAVAAIFGFTLATQATVILDDTWATGQFNVWNLPSQSPWYWPDTSANSNYIGVTTGSLILTNYSSVVTKTTYFWTFFTTNDPALTVSFPPGQTNIISDSTNAYYGNPVDIAVGQMVQATLVFQPNGFIMDTAAKGLRFGLMSYDATPSGRPTRNTSNISKSGTNVLGYIVDVPITGTVTNNMFSFRGRTNNFATINTDNQDPMGKTTDYFSIGGGPTLNIPGFQADQQYTLQFSVARYASSNIISASISGPLAGVALTNFSRAYSDTSGSNYHKFDCFMMRGDSGSPVVDSLILNEFKVEVLPITFAITTAHSIDADNFRLIWQSVSGQKYRVDSKNDLSAPSWTPLDTVTAVGTTTTWTNMGVGAIPSRCYRVVNTP